MIRHRTAIAVSIAVFVVLAGAGAGNASWSTQATVSGSIAAGRIGVTQSGFALLAMTFTPGALVTARPVTVTNSGTIPASHSLAVGSEAPSDGDLAAATSVSSWAVSSAAECTTAAVPPVIGLATGSWGSSSSLTVTTSAPLAPSASVIWCIRSAITEPQRASYEGRSVSLTARVTSSVGSWTSSATDTATQSVSGAVVPSTPGHPVASGITDSSVRLTWPTVNDDVAPFAYLVYRDGVMIASVDTPEYTDTGLAVSTTYTYTVESSDAAGTLSSPTAPISVTTLDVADDGWYRIVNPNSGMCLDGYGAWQSDGTQLIIWGCHGGSNQVWRFAPTTDGFSSIVAQYAPTLVWDVDDTNGLALTDGAPVQLWTDGGRANQQWTVEMRANGIFQFVNRGSGKCLDIAGGSTAEGTQLQQLTCENDSVAQEFTVTRVG